jgi:hypothetical protein
MMKENPDIPVTIAFDGWTDTNGHYVTNVTVIFKGTAYYIHTITQTTDSSSAEHVAPLLQPVLEKFTNHGIRVVAMCADNASVNRCIISIIQQKFPHIIHIPCAAHTIQLVVNNGFLASTRVDTVMRKIKSIIRQFQRNKSARQTLLKNTTQQGKTTRNTIIRIVPTRWSSTLTVLDRMLYIQEEITYTMRCIKMHNIPTPEFWDQVCV